MMMRTKPKSDCIFNQGHCHTVISDLAQDLNISELWVGKNCIFFFNILKTISPKVWVKVVQSFPEGLWEYKLKIFAKCSSFYPISAQQTLSTGKLSMSFNDTAFVPFNGNSDSTLWKIFSQMRTDSNEQTLYLFLVMFVMKGFLSFPIKTAEDKDKKIGKLCNRNYIVVWTQENLKCKESIESTKDKENAGQHPYLNCSEALRLKLSEWSTYE